MTVGNQQLGSARIETNRELGKRFFVEQDRLRGGPAAELCTSDYSARLGSGPLLDLAGHQGFAIGFYTAFPDVRHHIEQVIADENSAVVRFVLKGHHTGSFFGIPASGRPIEVPAHVILHIRGGQVSELFGIFDEAGLLRQIGVLPSG